MVGILTLVMIIFKRSDTISMTLKIYPTQPLMPLYSNYFILINSLLIPHSSGMPYCQFHKLKFTQSANWLSFRKKKLWSHCFLSVIHVSLQICLHTFFSSTAGKVKEFGRTNAIKGTGLSVFRLKWKVLLDKHSGDNFFFNFSKAFQENLTRHQSRAWEQYHVGEN